MSIKNQIAIIQKKIHNAASACGRDPYTIQLIAVSKGQSVSAIQEAFDAGLSDFGESYLQEALIKQKTLNSLPIRWHFIGPIQSNKTKAIALYFDSVQSVDREKIAIQLNKFRDDKLPPLDVFIQVNLDEEISKSGVSIDKTVNLAQTILTLPRLRLRGLMAIPKRNAGLHSFNRLNTLRETINNTLHITLEELSIGMTDDFEKAIQAGSTMIRIGRGLFTIQK